jgi:hypothetical protein
MAATEPLPIGAETWGFPHCRECGYAWDTGFEEARVLIQEAPRRLRGLLKGQPHARRKPNATTWSPSGYVWHLSDWFRIQAQRIYGISHDPDYVHVGYDQDDVAALFRYDELPVASGLWAIERSAEEFQLATEDVDPATRFRHPDAGDITIEDVVRYVGHEAPHHELDVRRGLGIA